MQEPERSALEDAERHGRGDTQAGLARRGSAEFAELMAESGHALERRERALLYESYCAAYARRAGREELVDAGSEMSFPASDPPSYMGGAAAGPPPHEGEPPREKPTERVTDPGQVREVQPTDGTGTGTGAEPRRG